MAAPAPTQDPESLTPTSTQLVHLSPEVSITVVSVHSRDGDADLVGWDGPDDPENPMNWPLSRKVINVGLMSLLTIISPLGSSMFAPGVKSLLTEFNSTSNLLATFVVSIYFLGYAFGPLVFAPLSEIYGRVYLYHLGNLSFIVICVGAAKSNSMGMLLAFRFLMGVFGSAPTTVGVGSIIDIVPLEWRGRTLSLWAMGPLLGPSIGPVIGGYVTEGLGWRWVYWILAIMGGVLGTLGLIFMRETYAPALLEKKARRLRKEKSNPNLKSSLGERNHKAVKLAVMRPLKLLFTSPLVAIIAVYVGIGSGILNLLISTFSFVYADEYHFDEGDTGLTFLPAGIGMMIGVLTFGNVADYLVRKAKEKQGADKTYKPEVKLSPWVTAPVGVALPAGLFIYGWTVEKHVHWIVPMMSVALFSFSLMGATMSMQNYQVDSYPMYAASGTAAITLFRSLIGALLPLGGLELYDAIGVGWGNSLLGFISLALIPVPIYFFYFGEGLRKTHSPKL